MEVRIERMLYGGAGTGQGAEVPAPFVLLGELVEIGDAGVTVTEASPERVAPGCVHFGVCGGCQYQHATYPTQVEIKQGILREVLDGAVIGLIPEIEVRTGEPWGYRNRVRLRLQVVDGVIRVGYSRRGSNEFLTVKMCPIAAPVIWQAAEGLVRLAADDAAARRWLERATEVEIFCSDDEARVQMSFSLRDAEVARQEPFAAFCEKVKREVPELVGAGVEIDPEAGRRLRKGWAGSEWGAQGLAYEVGGRRYWVARGAFFQVNRFLVGEMVGLATEGRRGGLAWDLFAGVGLFSRALAEGFERVVAVEGSAVSAAELGRVGRKVRAVESPAVEFLGRAVLERERPELVVLDPPRAGLGAEGSGLLGRIGAREVVYVSCDPVTLGRDLAVLERAGYGLERVVMVDMFPQTFHIETVVWLRKK